MSTSAAPERTGRPSTPAMWLAPAGRLLGVVTVRSLLLARDSQLVSDVMEDGVISVATGTDQEEAVRLLQRYGFLSLPVVDAEGPFGGHRYRG